MAKALRIAGNILFILLLIILSMLLFFLVQSRLSGGPPTVAGYRLFSVQSDSMRPTLRTGSLIIVKPIEPEELQIGDIISYLGTGNRVITHRITGKAAGEFITQGDANNIADLKPVKTNQVIGTLALAIPWLGRVLVFSQSRNGLLILIMIPSFVILVLEARSLIIFTMKVDREESDHAASRP